MYTIANKLNIQRRKILGVNIQLFIALLRSFYIIIFIKPYFANCMNVHIEIYLLIIYHCSLIFECVNVYHDLERGE